MYSFLFKAQSAKNPQNRILQLPLQPKWPIKETKKENMKIQKYETDLLLIQIQLPVR